MRRIASTLRVLQRQIDARMDCAGFAMHELKYDQDFNGGTQQQAQLLRQLRNSKIDVDNVVEEIETAGRSERRKLIFRVRMPLAHRLTWQFGPKKRGRFWRLIMGGNRGNPWNHHILRSDHLGRFVVRRRLSDTYPQPQPTGAQP
jgi:Domain of unknown function DUF29